MSRSTVSVDQVPRAQLERGERRLAWLRMRRARRSSRAPTAVHGLVDDGKRGDGHAVLGAAPTIDVLQLVCVTPINCEGPSHAASAPHRLEHPGRALDQPPAHRSRRRELARRASRRDGHLPRPRRPSAAASRRRVGARPHGPARRPHARAGRVLRADGRADRRDPRRGHDHPRPARLQLRRSEHDQVVGRPPDRARAVGRPRDQGRAARRPRPDRAGLARRRLRARHAARGLGPRRAVAPARPAHDRSGAALHHRRADAGRGRRPRWPR